MGLLGRYKNGNFVTTILSDGTKIRETKDDEFIPAFAENMDIKLTNKCNGGCAWCHEGSSINGKHGDILNEKFIDTLHPYQEIAIGGGDATSHPDLIPFLQKLKEKKVIANMTVNQIHFEKKQEIIKQLVDEKLIYGLGVSLVNPTKHFIELIKQYPNAVIHVINGVLKPSDIKSLDVPNNSFANMILADTYAYRKSISKKSVKKTVSIPEWLDELIRKKNWNLSQIFQESLISKLGIEST